MTIWSKVRPTGAACLLGLLVHGSAHAASIVVDGSDQKRTYDCSGGNAIVNGGDNVLTLQNCESLTVNGADNAIDAGTPRAITVLGSGNKITWTEAEGRPRPKIVNAGGENVVERSGLPAASSGGSATGAAPRGVVVGGDSKRSVVSASTGKGITVLENGRLDTLDCGGGPASVVGNNNALTLQNCSELSVTGNGNKIEAGQTPAIAVIGQSNYVTWTERPGGAAPKVSNLGQRNAVLRQP